MSGCEGPARRRAVGALVAVVCLGTAWSLSLAAAMPTTVLTASWGERDRIRTVLPQSWAFFTRDPRTPALQMFATDGSGDRVDGLPQSRAANGWGIRRGQRSQDTEKVLLAERTSAWTVCAAGREACLAEALRSAPERVPGAKVAPHFCGGHLLAWTEPVSFLFLHEGQDVDHLIRVAHVAVLCD